MQRSLNLCTLANPWSRSTMTLSRKVPLSLTISTTKWLQRAALSNHSNQVLPSLKPTWYKCEIHLLTTGHSLKADLPKPNYLQSRMIIWAKVSRVPKLRLSNRLKMQSKVSSPKEKKALRRKSGCHKQTATSSLPSTRSCQTWTTRTSWNRSSSRTPIFLSIQGNRSNAKWVISIWGFCQSPSRRWVQQTPKCLSQTWAF